MRPKTNALRLLALSVMIGACGSGTKTPVRRPLLVGLPVDSLIKTLGPDIAKHHLSGSSSVGSDNTSRFEETYIADFDVPITNLALIKDMAAKVSAVVAQRGGRVRGSSSTGPFTTFDYSADSLYGLVAIAAIKSDRPNFESLVISVREIVASVR